MTSVDGNGNVTRYTYNEKDEITGITNAEGNTRSFVYNHNGKVIKMTNYDGSVIELEYDGLNHLSRITDQEGNHTEYMYDKMWNISKVTDAEGDERQYIYNEQNLLEQVIDAEGNRTRYYYDACGNLTMIQDADGRITKFYYDELNRMVKVEEADGLIMKFSYDGEGNIIAIDDNFANHREMTYDNRGKKISDTDKMGRTTDYEYDAVGNLIKVTDFAGRVTEYTYRSDKMLEKVVYPDGTWECYSYDGCGNIIRKEHANGYVMNYGYDCMNRLIYTESSEGQKQYCRYDAIGNVIEITDANGNKTIYDYDKRRNLTKITNPEGSITEYKYDKKKQLMEVWQASADGTESGKRLLKYERNRVGQITGMIDALERMETIEYDAVGRIIKRKDRDGYQTDYQYNIAGQPKQITYGDGKQVEFSYNALRQLQEVKDWMGTTTFDYDEIGRICSIMNPQGKELRYVYGEQGEKKAIIYPNGEKVNYEYDELLRLKVLDIGDRKAFYDYDQYGRMVNRRTSDGITSEYQYNAMGLVQSLVHMGKEGILESYAYQYDSVGNRIFEERYRKDMEQENGSYAYDYDCMHRLIRMAKDGQDIRSYQYDVFGNRIKKVEDGIHTDYSYNALNQLISDVDEMGERTYEYDNRGNLTSVTDNGQRMHSYNFDAMNRLASAMDEKGNVAEYYYNGLGCRIGMQQGRLNGIPENGVHSLSDLPEPDSVMWDKQIEYVLDYTKKYNNIIQRQENGISQSYFWDRAALFMKADKENYDYLEDMQGSTMRLLNPEGQSKISYGYDEFGRDLYGNQGKVQPFGYTGYQNDRIAGSYYAQARQYHPRTGRFISEDPIGYAGNWYAYCSNNPLFYIDPMGLEDVDIAPEILEKISDWVREKDAYKEFASATRSGKLNKFLDTFDFVEDSEGVYHTRKDCWQIYFGYNDTYDYVFDAATDMDRDKYVAEVDGVQYIIWLWKGDYTNLGAGAETGIYDNRFYRFTPLNGKQWRASTDNSLPMTLSLYNKDGEQIYDYRPGDTQWWITGFYPDLQDVEASDLTVVGTIDLSGNTDLFQALYDEYYGDATSILCFDEDSYTIWYRW